MKIKKINIQGLFGLVNNDFNIECYPNEKISIVYAFNGAGKTTLLRLIYAASKNDKSTLKAIPFKNLELIFNDGKIISIEKANPKAEDYTYRIDGKMADGVMLAELQKEFKVTSIFANKDYNRGISTSTNDEMLSVDVNPIVRIERELREKIKDPVQKGKVEELRDIINKNFTMTFKHLDIQDNELIAAPDSKYPDDPKLPIHELSSGEIKLILMFYDLLFETTDHSIVLLDEPESSLHVDWQKDLLRTIIDTCDARDIQIIVATHSPDVVEDYFTQLTPMLSKRYEK